MCWPAGRGVRAARGRDAAAEASVQPAGIDPQANAILKESMDYLAGLKAFSVDTTSTIEATLTSGQKLQFDNAATPHCSGRTSWSRARKRGCRPPGVLLRRQDVDALEPGREGRCDAGGARHDRGDARFRPGHARRERAAAISCTATRTRC